MTASGRFVRVPTDFLETLLRMRLSGTQWAILFWVTRRTLGWNRNTTPFSWYRIAVDLTMDRGGVVRAARHLLRVGALYLAGDEIGLGGIDVLPTQAQAMTKLSADGPQRKPMTRVSASDDRNQRTRCQESSFFRRAKDSSKDKLKTYKDRLREPQEGSILDRGIAGSNTPVPLKYERLSQS